MISARGLRDRDQFGFARAAAGHGEHQDRSCGQGAGASLLSLLDVWAQALIIADGDLIAIIVERMDRVEAVIEAEARVAIALDNIEKQSMLNFARLRRQLLPARPLAAREEGGGFKKNCHEISTGALRILRMRAVPRRFPLL